MIFEIWLIHCMLPRPVS